MPAGRFANLEFEGQPRAANGADAASAVPVPTADSATARFMAPDMDAQAYLAHALTAELAGAWETALRHYSSALGEDPLCLDAWLGQVRMLLELGEYPEARLWTDKALEKYPEHPQLLATKAVALYRMGMRREAREWCDAALEKKGESELVWLCRGELMLADSRAAADDCFSNAVRVASDRGLANLRVGAVCSRYRRFSSALPALREATAALPRSAWAWYLFGCVQRELGLGSQAGTAFAQALDLQPQDRRFRDAAAEDVGVRRRITGAIRRLFRR